MRLGSYSLHFNHTGIWHSYTGMFRWWMQSCSACSPTRQLFANYCFILTSW